MVNWRLKAIWIYALIGPVIIGGFLAVIIGSIVYDLFQDWEIVVDLLILLGIYLFVAMLITSCITFFVLLTPETTQ